MDYENSPILPLWEGALDSHAEAHSRPAIAIGKEVKEVWHWVFQTEKSEPIWKKDPSDNVHRVFELENGVLRWERHTEFWGLTYVGSEPLNDKVTHHVSSLDASLLTGIRIHFSDSKDGKPDPGLFIGETLLAGRFKNNQVTVFTDFRQQTNGCVNAWVGGSFIDSADKGRFVKRLIDLEIYRFQVLRGLSFIRPKFIELEHLERAYSLITNRLSQEGDTSLDGVIGSFKELAAKINQLADNTRYRITATRAYYNIIKARLDELRETPYGAEQSVAGFIKQRIDPAHSTVAAFDRRARQLERSISTSLRLYNAMIDNDIQKQNQLLLVSMNKRTQQQVRLSKAVEGFSVIALTYYGAGLVYYMLSAFETGLDELAVAAAVPLIAAFAWWRTRYSKRRASSESDT